MMATPQPQSQPPQPIFATDLNNALDRQYARLVNYVDARIDALITQMRVYREESIARDIELRDGMKSLADAILKLGQRVGTIEQRVGALEQRMSAIEATQNAIIETLQAMRQEMRAGFAALDEKVNELTARVVHLEGGLPPSAKSE